jgi:hypothetical protein
VVVACKPAEVDHSRNPVVEAACSSAAGIVDSHSLFVDVQLAAKLGCLCHSMDKWQHSRISGFYTVRRLS